MTQVDANALNDPVRLQSQLPEIYDLYRTALLNRKYYGDRLAAYQRWNTLFELTLAGGTSAGVGGLVFWQSSPGQLAWGIVAGIAAVFSVIKPILQLTKKIELYTTMYVSYSNLYAELGRLVSEIRAQRRLTPEILKSFVDVQAQITWLTSHDEPHPSEKLVEKYYSKVNEEIPQTHLWVPQ